uniref:Putative secreted peptide n=1 Tax=Anopheles braziliensis TaxID=58242 RepID=A0A2M3ZUX4_9DIPT
MMKNFFFVLHHSAFTISMCVSMISTVSLSSAARATGRLHRDPHVFHVRHTDVCSRPHVCHTMRHWPI